MIVAVAENGVIGADGGLPWRLADDLRRFRALTTGHCIIMGRRTYDSIGRPLPDRTSIVLTRDPSWTADGVHVASSLDDALAIAASLDDEEAFVIGGAEIYRIAMPIANRLHVTLVHATVDGDTLLPTIDPAAWRVVHDEKVAADERNEHAVTYRVLERCGGG